jgi:hypothetical protein
MLFRNRTVILKASELVNNVILHSGHFFSVPQKNATSPPSVTQHIPVSASQLKIFASVCAGYLPLPL